MHEFIGQLTPETLSRLRESVRCQVAAASDATYDSSRRIWNGMFDRRPSAIVQPESIADVMQCVRFAREHGLAATVRGGGHGVAGKAVADGAMMIDLSRMRVVEVNPGRRTALAQGGATWSEFDQASEKYGLATTGGVISSTGVSGLALGGGLGWLMGKHRLSCDNIISADLVNADGKHVTASAEQNEDLFWAIRGGGGNFGIVTALEFRLHELSTVHGGMVLYPRASAIDLLRQYRDVTAKSPDELTAYASLLVGHGNPMVAIAFCHSGSEQDGLKASEQLRLPSPPVVDMTGKKRYTEIQTMLDFTAPAGRNYYFKCPFLRELSDEAITAIVDHCAQLPSEESQVVFEHMHGAASRVPVAETAFGLRRVHYSLNVIAAWDDPAKADKCIAWAQSFGAMLKQFGGSDAYVNYLGEEGQGAVKASYGANYERLAALKTKYDPDNFFRFNQNIPPTS